jgi:type III secretion protein D
MTTDLELIGHIFAGRYANGVVSVALDAKIHIGYEFFNDVVLRTPSVKGNRIELTIGVNATRLRAVEGCVEVLGQKLSLGSVMLLPHYTPICIGGEHIAFGYVGAVEWERSMALALSPPPLADEQAEPLLPVKQEAPWTRWFLGLMPSQNPLQKRPVITTISALVVVAAFSMWNVNIAELIGVEKSPNQIKADIEKMGAYSLTVEKKNKVVNVSGFIDTKKQANAISNRFIHSKQKIKLSLSTGTDIAQSASDILRVQGLNGEVHYLGHHSVEVVSESLEPEQMNLIKQKLLRDVPGLRSIRFNEKITTKYAGVNALASAVSNPGKRVSLLVSGDSGYLVTADGGRYFVGATLPTGHQIMSIDKQQVMLQQNGAAVKWLF